VGGEELTSIHAALVPVFLLLTVVQSAAYCSEPSAPYSKPIKPTVPYCVDRYAKTHTCDSWEIDSYNSAISSFNYDYDRYVRALKTYLDEAVEYAQCELKKLED
jgi:hypothetical protein